MNIITPLLLIMPISTSIFAGTTNIKCPIPAIHMKADMFSGTEHKQEALIQNSQTGMIWHIFLTADQLILNKNAIDSFLRANKVQEYAYEGSGLGSCKYQCKYLRPLPARAFTACNN